MLAVTERECGSVGPASPHLGAAQGIRRCFQTYCGPFAPSKLGLFFHFLFLSSHLYPRILKESDKEVAKVGS